MITGANRGLGLALAGVFGREGFRVVATSRSDAGIEAAETALGVTSGEGGRVWCQLDMSREEDIRRVGPPVAAAPGRWLGVWDLGFRIEGLCFRFQDLGFRAVDNGVVCSSLTRAGFYIERL